MPFRYRADNVGSLLRPAELLAARNLQDAQLLRALEDEHVQRVLAKQKDLGFEIFTDGELRRQHFMSNFIDAVDGFDMTRYIERDWNAGIRAEEGQVRHIAGIVSAKLRQIRPLTEDELGFPKKHSPGDIKILLPSATQFPAISFRRGVTDKTYRDHSALLWDIVEIMKRPMREL